MTHFEVQNIAKETMQYIKSKIAVGMSLIELRRLAENKMIELGATSFWYYNIGALIFSADETTISTSGKKYKTPEKIINENDIITVDLSPCVKRIWGDFARTLIIENGILKEDLDSIENTDWKNGLITENKLHGELISFATPDTTFEEVYIHFNKIISDLGYVNLDFLGNLGHSVESFKRRRIYIEKGNQKKLSSVKYFTFEPHISQKDSSYGYKKEDIYYFEKDKLNRL